MIHSEVQIGDCRLLLGDCLEILPTLAPGSVDCVITSPPYNLGTHHRDTKHHDPYPDNLPEDEYQSLQVEALSQMYHVSGCVFYNHKNRIRDGIEISPRQWINRTPWGVRQTCVWINGGPNHDPIRFFPKTERIYWLAKDSTPWLDNRSQWDVFTDYPDHIALHGSGHTRTFPVSLVEKILSAAADYKTILDPYMGSGTTLIACIKMGRKGIGIEKDERYFDIACKRIQKAYDDHKIDLFSDTRPKRKVKAVQPELDFTE